MAAFGVEESSASSCWFAIALLYEQLHMRSHRSGCLTTASLRRPSLGGLIRAHRPRAQFQRHSTYSTRFAGAGFTPSSFSERLMVIHAKIRRCHQAFVIGRKLLLSQECRVLDQISQLEPIVRANRSIFQQAVPIHRPRARWRIRTGWSARASRLHWFRSNRAGIRDVGRGFF
jgi:hypothetical protein